MFEYQSQSRKVYVVTGLPRSGTSLAMQLLAAANIPPYTDGLREADINNPKGYFESEKVLRLPVDSSWMNEVNEQAVKVVIPLLRFLPDGIAYKVIFMERVLSEVVLSQEEMLKKLGKKGAAVTADKMMDIFRVEVERAKDLLSRKPLTDVCFVSYSGLLAKQGGKIEELAAFIGRPAAVEPMRDVIDPDLYRRRSIG